MQEKVITKPHDIREELIIPAVKGVIQTVMHKSTQQIICSIPLRNSSLQRRINEMASNVLTILCAKSSEQKHLV